MSIEESIRSKITEALLPAHLEIENESHMHSGPAQESHFRVVVVSDQFDGKRLVQRHQLVYKTCAEELAGPVHALSMHLYTAAEWSAREQDAPLSPDCMGGSKSD